jgi:3'(2'), 5'-bisphosphate nucleotidase
MDPSFLTKFQELGDFILHLQKDISKLETKKKEGGSPVSSADLEADRRLKILLPQLVSAPVFSEEDHPYDLGEGDFWVIDPIDGTKDFLSGGKDFCVCAVFFKNTQPSISIIYAPAHGELYWAKKNAGAFLVTKQFEKRIFSNQRKVENLSDSILLESRSHPDARTILLKEKSGIEKFLKMGSALKFCKIAAGEGDLSFRFTPSWDWDVAPGHLILSESGGDILALDPAKEIIYNSSVRKVHPFVAASGSVLPFVHSIPGFLNMG